MNGSMKGFLLALVDREFYPSAIKVALVVGSLLFTINHGAALITGTLTTPRLFSGILTYIVPYIVNVQGQYSSRLRSAPRSPTLQRLTP